MWMISKIITILFPSHCYKCQKEGFSLCASCLKNCKKSLDTPEPYITSIYSFKDPLIKKLIHAIKYFHRKDLIEPLTQELAHEIRVTDNYKGIADDWTLVPIPMPRLRKYMRGYNQAEYIAQSLSQQCSLPINTDLLNRLSSPQRQVTTKTRSERLKNQYHSFKVINDVRDMNIILVDDVTTTGATISEARRVLLKAGAKSVKALTIAH